MIVQELIELLEQQDPTALVVIASDPEGNGFAPVEDHCSGFFNAKTEEFFNEDEFFEEGTDYQEEEDEKTKPHGIPAFLLWPEY